jgi:hypothetical protein
MAKHSIEQGCRSSAQSGASSQAARGASPRCLEFAPSNDEHHHQEPTMTHRTDTLIQRAAAFALASLVTAVLCGSINSLASRDIAPDALLAHAAASSRHA